MTKSRIIKNYIYNTSYQILVLFVPLITTPYVSRVIGAEGLGVFGYVQSISAYFILFGTLGSSLYGRREIAYVQDDAKERTRIFKEICYFRFITVILSLIVYAFIFIDDDSYKEVYEVYGVAIAASAFDISWFFQGMEDFKKVIIRNSIIKIAGVFLTFLLVRNKDDVPLYVLCITLPDLIGNISLWFYLPRYLERSKVKVKAIISHIMPMMILFVPQIATEIYTVLDKTMLGKLCPDIAEVGYYTQSQKIIKITLQIITSLGTVMMPAISLAFAKGRHNQIEEYISRSFKFVFLIGFPIMFGLIGISEKFVPWFFGRGFDKVTILMIITSPIIIIIGISNILGIQYLLPTKQQNEFTLSVVCGALVNFIFNLIFIPLMNSIGAAIATILAEISVTLVQILFVRKKFNILSYMMSSLRYAVAGAVMGVMVYYIGKLMKAGIITTFMQVAAGMIIYLGELILIKDKMLLEGINLLSAKLKGRYIKDHCIINNDYRGNELKNHQQVIIKILKKSLNKEKFTFTKDDDIDWQAVMSEAEAHKVSSLVYFSLDKESIKSINDNPFKDVKRSVLVNNLLQINNMKIVKKIYADLEKAGIEVILLKGLILKELYPRPELRSMRDADILVKKDDYEAVKSYFLDEGYLLKNYEHDFHDTFISPKGIIIELHSKLVNDKVITGDISQFENKIWDNHRKVQFEGISVNTLSTEDFIIHLCFHMAVHTKGRGFGIRQLYDLALFIRYNYEEIKWNQLMERIRRYGILKFTVGIFILLNKVFEIDIPENILKDNDIDEGDINMLLENIFLSGVYGMKEEIDNFDKLSKYRSDYGRRYSHIKRMTKFIFPMRGDLSDKYSYAKNNILLLPLVWIMRIIEGIMRYGIRDTIRFMRKSFLIGDLRSRVIERFDL